jgi:hypothetical protein
VAICSQNWSGHHILNVLQRHATRGLPLTMGWLSAVQQETSTFFILGEYLIVLLIN